MLTIITTINEASKILSIKLNFKNQMFNVKAIDLNIDSFLINLVDIIKLLYIKCNNLEIFTLDSSFDLESYQKINEQSNQVIQPFYTGLLRCIEKNNEMDIIDIPSEFLDPIMYTLIEDPCQLPDRQEFFEKIFIRKQLLIKEENPFTRNKLTLQDLEKYNEMNDIKEKNMEFMEKLSEWKRKNIEKNL